MLNRSRADLRDDSRQDKPTKGRLDLVISGSASEGFVRDARGIGTGSCKDKIGGVVCKTASLILFEPQLEVTLSNVLPALARPGGLLPAVQVPVTGLARTSVTVVAYGNPGTIDALLVAR